MRTLAPLQCLLLVIGTMACASGAQQGTSTPVSAVASSTTEQRQVQAEVLAVVNRLWEAMRTNDSIMARSVFDSTAQMVSITTVNGSPFVRWNRVDRFVTAIGSAKEPWIERMVAPEVRVDGNLASVWTWYDFSRGGKVSHCGYDSIELARMGTEWKIIYIADTRQQTGCDKPPASN
jgi:hypothetical protein